MRATSVLIGLGLAALLSARPALATSFSDTLAEADRIRSSQPQQFDALLRRLDATKAKATEGERRHLRLLQDYRRVLHGEYSAAISDLSALFEQAPEPELKYRSALLIANTTGITRDFLTGLRYLNRATELGDRVPASTRDLGDEVAGSIFVQFDQPKLALRHAQALLDRESTPRSRCIAEQVRFDARFAIDGSFDLAHLPDALRECDAQREAIPVNLIRNTLARYWSRHGQGAEAIRLLERSLPDVQRTGYTRLIAGHNSLLAELYLEAGQLDEAATHAARVVADSGKTTASLPEVTAQHVLYDIALKRGQLDAALRHYRAYAEADKAYLDDVRAREYAFRVTQYELTQKNQSIALLSNQNQMLRLQQEASRASAWNFRLVIALLVVLLGSFAYWLWRARRTHGSLRTLAETDGLTGLSNRRHFRASSESALAQCAQRQRPVAVLLFDLDHFKQINDQCGHSSGDWVLREVARVGRLHCREGDLFGRIGGEEFAMTLVDCEVHDALGIAEACRRAIAAIDADVAGCGLPVAASIGVVGTRQAGYDYEALIAHADAAMYRSKVGGRNRVTLYEPPGVPAAGQPVLLDRRNAEAMLRQY
jgi:diguanylate cyclase (GGDEF)-like protein